MGTGMLGNLKAKGIKKATDTFCGAIKSPLGRQEILKIINPKNSSLRPGTDDLEQITTIFCNKL